MRFLTHGSIVLLLVLLVGLEVQAQTADSVPTIQPTFTRVHAVEGVGLSFPSLSPNGKWISFSAPDPASEDVSLWIVPAEGGEAFRLTRGAWDQQPVWFPSGDKLAFRSNRPARGGEGGSWVMTLPIDPETGSPNGPPRQVSIEECFAWLDVSPDGERIAFVAWTEGRKAILVVPAVGGPSRNLVEALTSVPVWAPDGESLYYSVDRFPPGEALLRVFLEDAQVDTVFTWPQHIRVFGPPEKKFVVRVISRNDNEDSVWEVATLEGVPLSRFELPRGMDSFSLTPDGGLLVVRGDQTTSVEVLPIDGGPPRELNLNGGRNTVLGWSPDGEQLLMKTALDGEDMYFFAATDGSLMRQVQFPEELTDEFTPVLSRDGNRIVFAATGSGGGSATLKALDLENGGIREISHPSSPVVHESLELSGRGTTGWQDGEDFLFVEQHGADYELRAAPPSGPSRLLRAFRGELPATIGVNEDWIAYEWGGMARRSVALARVGEVEPKMLLTFRGYLESITWAQDGTRLALTAYRIPEGQDGVGRPELTVLDVDPSGNVIGEPKILNAPDMVWWSPHWLPNGRGLLVVGNDGNIWQVSLEAGVQPVPVTGDLSEPVWWFQISPDGRSIAYAKSTLQGSSIWRVDLGEVVAGTGG